MMTKKDFILLANYIKEFNGEPFTFSQLSCLASFCKAVNPSFKRERWFNYIDNKCGPNGGPIK